MMENNSLLTIIGVISLFCCCSCFIGFLMGLNYRSEFLKEVAKALKGGIE